jgi:hypothetical protein
VGLQADRAKTKNLRFINGLSSFGNAIDCTVANNRLKPRREQGEFRLAPELALNIRIKTIFSTRNEETIRVRKMLCRHAVGNWESHERDIWDKI